MRARVLFSLVGALIAAVALVSASGAATTKAQKVTRIEVSTRAAVIHYLRSIHVNPKGAVIERGARNYAGAHCPGTRWTCASTRHTVVQIARRGGQNRFVCRSARCAVVQLTGVSHGVYVARRRLASTTASSKGNTATCIRTSGLLQSCSISQLVGPGPNTAIIYENAGKLSGLNQTAAYTASISQQSSGANSNTACIYQAIRLDGSTVAKSVPITVTLEAHQSATITQDATGSGANSARYSATPSGNCDTSKSLTQSQTLRSTATGRSSITQNEDAAFSACGDGVSGDYANLCLDIEQNQGIGHGVASGPNNATFTQTSTQTAIANTPAGPVSQAQSSICANNPSAPADCLVPGGLVGTVNQDSSGVSTASATQLETQCEDASKNTLSETLSTCHPNDPDAPTGLSLTQKQYGPVGILRFRHNHLGRQLYAHLKGLGTSTQTGNGADMFTINQTSTQDNDQGSGSTQTNNGHADCQTSGNCTATQTTNVDGQQSTNVATGSNVSAGTSCTGSTCTGTLSGSPPPTPTITGGPPNPSSSSSATFSFSDTNTSATFLCQLDDGGYTACTSPATYDNLADGSHTFSVEATQNGNTSSPATFTWTIGPVTVQQLNPTSDPVGGGCAFGYASGTGFNGTPGVVNDTVDLSQFNGQVQLRFSFSTGDALYNAFEGWYVKNIQVTGTQSGSPVTVFSDAVADGDTDFTASSDFGVTPGWHVTDRRDSTFGGPAWWYGDETTHTYQSPNPIDGCTDSSANAGTITSPVFTLATNSQLSFDTLWQIESVNPSLFDLMDVQLIPVTSGPPIG